MVCERGHTHLIVLAHACSYYSRAATISLAELQVRLLFEGGYYSRCGFYSNKYGIYNYGLQQWSEKGGLYTRQNNLSYLYKFLLILTPALMVKYSITLISCPAFTEDMVTLTFTIFTKIISMKIFHNTKVRIAA